MVAKIAGDDGDPALEAMLAADVDVNDVECEDGKVTLFAPPTEFYKAKQALNELLPEIELEVEEKTYLPLTSVDITIDDLPLFEKFINMLNDCEDVQDIYHNAILPR